MNNSVNNLQEMSPLKTPKMMQSFDSGDVSAIIQSSISNVSQILRKSQTKRANFMHRSFQQLPV